MNWTAEREDTLRRMWDANEEVSAIADRLGTSVKAVYDTRCRLGLPYRKMQRGAASNWTPERIAELTRLWTQGYSASQIATALGGVTRNAVIGKATRLGLGGRAKPSSPARRLTGQTISAAATKDRSGRVKGRSHKPKAVAKAPVADQADRAARADVFKGSPGVSFEDLQPRGQCRWPIGDPAKPGFGYCGATPLPENTYCETHHRIARVPLVKRRQRSASLDGYLDHLSSRRRVGA